MRISRRWVALICRCGLLQPPDRAAIGDCCDPAASGRGLVDIAVRPLPGPCVVDRQGAAIKLLRAFRRADHIGLFDIGKNRDIAPARTPQRRHAVQRIAALEYLKIPRFKIQPPHAIRGAVQNLFHFVKVLAARANGELEQIPEKMADAICHSVDELLASDYIADDDFNSTLNFPSPTNLPWMPAVTGKRA